MILAIDIGNTTVALAGFRGGEIRFSVKIDTIRGGTVEQYRAMLKKAFSGARHKPVRFDGVVLTSVVPELTQVLADCAADYCDAQPVIVSPYIRTGLVMDVDYPDKVGKDRIADAVGAAANYPLPVVTVDMGTATTFNVVDEQRRFLGGAICAGLSTSLKALNERCALLPLVKLGAPKEAIGKNTEDCILNGAVLGAAALVDGMADRFEAQLGRPVTVVATGGLSRFVVPFCRRKVIYDPKLMLKGLAVLYEENKPEPPAPPAPNPRQALRPKPKKK